MVSIAVTANVFQICHDDVPDYSQEHKNPQNVSRQRFVGASNWHWKAKFKQTQGGHYQEADRFPLQRV
jgi:hypothetical protein